MRLLQVGVGPVRGVPHPVVGERDGLVRGLRHPADLLADAVLALGELVVAEDSLQELGQERLGQVRAVFQGERRHPTQGMDAQVVGGFLFPLPQVHAMRPIGVADFFHHDVSSQ